jgi:hypothetical protein
MNIYGPFFQILDLMFSCFSHHLLPPISRRRRIFENQKRFLSRTDPITKNPLFLHICYYLEDMK